MSIQWMLIAYCLYLEIAVLVVLMLPIASPKRWSRMFRSRFFSFIAAHVGMYITVVLSIMGLLLYDAIREMRKYTTSNEPGSTSVVSDLKNHVKLFRAQRNFYITSFSILLVFVIRSVIKMIHTQANLVDYSSRIDQDLKEAVRTVRDETLHREISSNKESEDLRKLHDKLVVHQQERNSMQQTIIEMTAEVTALTLQIEMWKNKYNELAAKNKLEVSKLEYGDHE